MEVPFDYNECEECPQVEHLTEENLILRHKLDTIEKAIKDKVEWWKYGFDLYERITIYEVVDTIEDLLEYLKVDLREVETYD